MQLFGLLALRAPAPLRLLFLPLHPPVLEPDLDVALGEVEAGGQLVPAGSGDVPVEEKLLLQLQQLRPAVRCPAALVVLRVLAEITCDRVRRAPPSTGCFLLISTFFFHI